MSGGGVVMVRYCLDVLRVCKRGGGAGVSVNKVCTDSSLVNILGDASIEANILPRR